MDRAVDYAYQATKRFPDQRIFLTGEIIHNPHVNAQLRDQGIRFLDDPGEPMDGLSEQDVVILPAFGVTVQQLARLSAAGCTLVDTTCGSVLNVWKNVRRYAAEGFTSVIHGKYWHEETRATASQASEKSNGQSLIVLDRSEAEIACDFIRDGGDAEAFCERFRECVSPGFDPHAHLARIGCANQTTMLSTESLEVGVMFRDALASRYGTEALEVRFRAFDTICSATQDRQDAIVDLLGTTPVDLVLVLGGYNSSNTFNLARICEARVPTYHIASPDCLESLDCVRHRPVGAKAGNDHTRLVTARRPGGDWSDGRGIHPGQSRGRGH